MLRFLLLYSRLPPVVISWRKNNKKNNIDREHSNRLRKNRRDRGSIRDSESRKLKSRRVNTRGKNRINVSRNSKREIAAYSNSFIHNNSKQS